MTSSSNNGSGPCNGSILSAFEISDSDEASDEDTPAPAQTSLSSQRKGSAVERSTQERTIPKLKLRNPAKLSLAPGTESSSIPTKIQKTAAPRLKLKTEGRLSLPQVPIGISESPKFSQERPRFKLKLTRVLSPKRSGPVPSVSGSNEDSDSEDSSGSGDNVSEDDSGSSDDEGSDNGSDSDKEGTQPTTPPSKKRKIVSAVTSSLKRVGEELQPARDSSDSYLHELHQLLERKRLQSPSIIPRSFLPSQQSRSSQDSDRQSSSSEESVVEYSSASEPAESESGASPTSEHNSRPIEPIARKRHLSTSPAPETQQSPRKFKYRPVESLARDTTFASFFRQTQSSQSSQPSQGTRKRPSKRIATTGCVYVLHDDDTGHVKIGISGSAKKRHASLRRTCRKPNLTLEWHTGESIPRDQLQRLEKIIHWDLAQFNRRYKCDCGATHTEWFDVEIREAKRTVEMWLRYQRMKVDVTIQDLERLRTGFPKEEGHTWLGVRTMNHVKRYEYWHWKLFGEMYDEAFCEE